MTLPETNIEWLWALDRVELCGEIQRYRRLKKQGLDAHRAAAIEAIVRDGEGMPPKALADGAVAGAADRDRMARGEGSSNGD